MGSDHPQDQEDAINLKYSISNAPRIADTRNNAVRETELSDGDGLYLFITPGNSKTWRMDYRFPKGGKKRVIVDQFAGRCLAVLPRY